MDTEKCQHVLITKGEINVKVLGSTVSNATYIASVHNGFGRAENSYFRKQEFSASKNSVKIHKKHQKSVDIVFEVA